MPPYQSVKLTLIDILGLSRDGFHIVLAFLVWLLAARLFKTPLSSYKSLIAPLVFALFLEILDIRDASVYGYTIDLFDSVHDILFGLFLPLLTVIYLRTTQNLPNIQK